MPPALNQSVFPCNNAPNTEPAGITTPCRHIIIKSEAIISGLPPFIAKKPKLIGVNRLTVTTLLMQFVMIHAAITIIAINTAALLPAKNGFTMSISNVEIPVAGLVISPAIVNAANNKK